MPGNSDRLKPSPRRLLIALAAVLGTLAFWAPVAAADQTIQVSASPSPSIDGVTTTFTVSGSSDTGGTVYASLDPAGTSCASNPYNDNGSLVIFGDDVSSPSYSDSETATPSEGSYVVCAWLVPAGDDGSGTPLAGPASTPLTVAPLRGALTISAPVSVLYQQSIPVTVRWQADSSGSLLVNILPSSYGPCTADPADEPQYVGWLTGQNGYTNTDTIGDSASSGTNRYLAGELAPDTYRVCAWVEEPSGGVVVGPVSIQVRMLPLPGSRTYFGRTSQALPVSVTINGYTVQDIVYSARFRCGVTEYFSTGQRWNGVWKDTVLTSANFGTINVTGGHFDAKLDANPGNRVAVHGSLRGSRLRGTLYAHMLIGPPQFRQSASCRTGRIRFTIHNRSSPRPRRHTRHH